MSPQHKSFIVLKLSIFVPLCILCFICHWKKGHEHFTAQAGLLDDCIQSNLFIFKVFVCIELYCTVYAVLCVYITLLFGTFEMHQAFILCDVMVKLYCSC